MKTGGFWRKGSAFGLRYIKPDLSRRSVRRTGRDVGLALKDGDGMGRPVYLWPASSPGPLKLGERGG